MKHLFFIAVLLLANVAFAQEDHLISILKSDSTLQEKNDACRELAHIGTAQAVPTLAQLLTDEKLSHMARYALEPIADPSVDTALRNALDKLKGPLLAGVIDSLGVRKDKKAVEPLASLLADSDPAVAHAAACALGDIGGPAAQALQDALSRMSNETPANQLAVCEGLFRCAEAASDAEAAAIYDKARATPNLPPQAKAAALRGAILSRGAHGIPLWIEAVQSESPLLLAEAMGVSMDIPGEEMTRVMLLELSKAASQKRLLLLQTLGYRGDVAATPALVPLAETGPANERVAAIRSLVQLGSPSAIPVLVALVKDSDKTVSNAAQTGLIGFPGKETDAAALALLNESDAKCRVAAIDILGQRRVEAAVQPLLKATGDADSDVANASFKTLGELADVAEIPSLIEAMVKTKNVAAAETALSAICSRQPDTSICTDKLLLGLASVQGEPKHALLRVLGAVGDSQALAAVRTAANDSDESVRQTALRALCDWPTAEALPDLAQLAKTTPDAKLRILAVRGQLRLIPTQTVSDALKLSQLKEVLPLIDRTEEQRLALAILSRLPGAESLALVMTYSTQEELKDEASIAAVGIAENIAGTHPSEVAEAMKQIQTTNDELAKRIRDLSSRAPVEATDDGFVSIFNGKDLTGWDAEPGWWTVEDGALTAESTLEKPCKACNYLIWRNGQPADFELLADFKLSLEANSGIQIRSEARPAWDTYGYQADMTGNGDLIGFIYHHEYGLIVGRGVKAVFTADGKQSVEQIADPAELLKHFKQGEWNTYRIVCHGPDITLYLNGALMCQVTDHRVAQAARRGIVALQMHPGPPMKIQFRNIRLKEMK